MKILVIPEGRDDIWVPDPDSLIAWIKEQNLDYIHNFITELPGMFIGADHELDNVIDDIQNGERLALTTGDVWKSNMKHALSIVKDNKLQLYDIGEITESDLVLEHVK